MLLGVTLDDGVIVTVAVSLAVLLGVAVNEGVAVVEDDALAVLLGVLLRVTDALGVLLDEAV